MFIELTLALENEDYYKKKFVCNILNYDNIMVRSNGVTVLEKLGANGHVFVQETPQEIFKKIREAKNDQG